METTTYPVWQVAIRKAQAEAREAARKAEAERQAKDAEFQAEQAQQFADRLAAAGIAIDPKNVEFWGLLGDPRVTIDGYEFTYIRRTENNILSVAKRLPENPEIIELDPEGHSSYSGVVHEIIDVYRGEIKAHEIADAIDHIESRIPDVSANNARVLERLRQGKSEEEVKPEAKPELLDPYRVISEKNDYELQSGINRLYQQGYRLVSMSMSSAVEDVVWTTVIMELQS